MIIGNKLIKISINSQTAESGPPLSTVLGNLGVNTVKFCKEFNEFTKNLPSYFNLKVHILVLENKSYTFKVFPPSLGSLINLLKYERKTFINKIEKNEMCIDLKNLVQLAKYKFPGVDLIYSLPVVFGTVKSFGIKILK